MSNLYEKYKKPVIIIGLTIMLVSIIAQLLIAQFEKMDEEDLTFPSLGWSEYCDGRNYTLEEKTDFCQSCFIGSGTCDWPLDMTIGVAKANAILKTGGEIHCYNEIDGVNYYREKGRYYGVTNETFFTWEVIDATQSHDVTFCCWIERKNIASLFSIDYSPPTACITKSVTPRCTP